MHVFAVCRGVRRCSSWGKSSASAKLAGLMVVGLALALAGCGSDEQGPTPVRDSDEDTFPQSDLDLLPDDPVTQTDDDIDAHDDDVIVDLDSDNDTWPDDVDAFPQDPTEWLDSDDDSVGDNADADDDDDGVPDVLDDFPVDPTETLDSDNDGLGDNSDSSYTVIASRIATLETADVIIDVNGDLDVAEALVWASSHSLILKASGSITIRAAITGNSGQLILHAGDTITDTSAVSVHTFTLQAGQWAQNSVTLPAFSATDFRIAGGSFLRVKGGTGADATHAYRIIDIYGLQGVDTYLSSYFALANNIDASSTAGWNNGAGFEPIGSDTARFSGDFDGARFIVSDLLIRRPGISHVGLFSALAMGHTIRNIGLEGGSVDAHWLQTGHGEPATNGTGALVALNYGTVMNSYANVQVTGYERVGGLVGINYDTVDYGRAGGAVRGRIVFSGDLSGELIAGVGLGGLVGENQGTVTRSSASGSVQGQAVLGGLVGKSYGLVSNCLSTATVSGSSTIGGLVGDNTPDGANAKVEYSYASGALSASSGAPRGIAGRTTIVNIGDAAERSVKYSRWDTDSTGAGSGCADGSDQVYYNCANYVNDADTTAWPRTTAQMMQLASFGTWGISTDVVSQSIWYIAASTSRPQLRAFAAIDSDSDGVGNPQDAFPFDADEASDSDGDGVGDNADELPLDPLEIADTDQDGIGNDSDPDMDGDGVPNTSDAFFNDPTEWADADSDGFGDNVDAFDDNVNEWADTNSDGLGDNGQRLIQTVVEVGGGHYCEFGGTVTLTGLDEAPRNNVLDPGEIDQSQTSAICDPQKLTISGSVTGLPLGESLTLSNGVGGTITIAGQDQGGSLYTLLYSFESVITGNTYAVTAGSQPASRFCEPTSGTVTGGTLGASNITGVNFACYKHGEVVNKAGSGTPSPELLGNGGFFASGYVDGAGLTQAKFNAPYGVAVDAAGNVYVADTDNWAVRKVSPSGVVSTVSQSFYRPQAVVVDKNGVVYVADTGNNRVSKIDPTNNNVSIFATSCGATALTGPKGVAVDGAGTVYIADTGNHRICKVTPAGVATVFAGSGIAGNPSNATGTAAQFRAPEGLGVDASGAVYVADSGNYVVRKISQAGAVTTMAGSTYGYLDATIGTQARFALPRGIAVALDGTLYVADAGNRRIRKITPAGAVSTVAGSSLGYVDGVGAAAQFSYPAWVALDGQNNLYVVDEGNQRVRKIYQTADGGTGTPPTPITDNGWTPAQLQTAFNDTTGGFASAAFLMTLLKDSWNTSIYGPIPADGVLYDFALTQCKFAGNCMTAGDAMMLTVNLVQSDDTYYGVISAWNDVRAYVGWGGTGGIPSSALPSPTCSGSIASGTVTCSSGTTFPFIAVSAGGTRIPNEIKQDMWKRSAAADRLIFTAQLLRGLLATLEPGDPGYGTSLVTALKNLRDQNNVITRGFMGVLLLADVAGLIEKVKKGETLTAVQQTLSNNIVSQVLGQEKAALAKLQADYTAYDNDLRPPGYAGLNWLGATPTDDMKNTLATLIPSTSNSLAANETAAVSMRLLAAIGQSAEAAAGYSGNNLTTAMNVLAVPFGVTIGAIVGGGTAAALYATGTSVTALVKVIFPFALRAAGAAVSGVVSVVAGPVLIIASALALLIQGALLVADIDAFLNSMTFVSAYLDLASASLPSLYGLSETTLGIKVCASEDPSAGCGVLLRLGGAEQLQWAVINLIAN